MPAHQSPLPRADRRREPRWKDKRLLTLRETGGEHPGMTADISPSGMRLALSRPVTEGEVPVEISVAFAQEVVEIQGHLVHTRPRPWGMLAGVRFTPGQAELFRFLARRYPPPPDHQPLFQPLRWTTPGSFQVLPAFR